ncbi:toxin glutamine deamidase domain-containing protein [Micromonospora tulbaghiae]|uniref:toxin glutamine deamidase domain-containing protein n=1 Tax=Micromonospora tulbaghiae TaxID=479978 RepID=UPI0029C184B9|nr:toxin glutamine deamidase domain-containing protein [Micromonospora tulbaghiae]MDX5461011.1 toxin glutamine deamidase domain-containing protein [Micromonospora tulbaghiae]
MLPSPIPHPLDFCPWDLPGWIYEALDWVVGVEWPEGNERTVWDLADQWYGVAGVLTRPRDDAVTAAGEVKSGYGGVGLVAGAFDTAWHKLAEGEGAPLHVLVAATGELARLVDSCGCDIEGAKLEAWIELGILVIELLSLAVATVLTLGAASPAAAAAITATRVVVQQIFKRLVAQLARKAVKQGLKEAGERAVKEVAKSGVRTLARRAAIGGLLEAGQEAGTSLGTQAYQNSTGRRDGLDLSDVSTSALGGFAGGAVAPLAGLGRHANGRLAEIGERFGREMAGETLAETAAGLATGQGPSLEDLARAAASGATGSATNQTDSALQRRLDGQLSGLTVSPVGLDPPVAADPAGQIPAQRVAEPIVQSGDTIAGSVPATPTHVAPQAAGPHPLAVDLPRPVPDPTTTPSIGDVVPHDVARPAVATSPTLSSMITDAPVVGPSLPATGVHGGAGAVVAPIDNAQPPSTPVQAGAAPATLSPPTADHPPVVAPPLSDRTGPGVGPSTLLSTPSPQPHAAPFPGLPGPDPRPTPNPRFPLLESLAPPRPSADLPGPAVGPPPPDLRSIRERAARLVADRDSFDRRRYRGHLQSQRTWFEDRRRETRADWLHERATYHEERASDWAAQAMELRRAGRTLAAERWHRESHEASLEAADLREEARHVLAGRLVPGQVMVEDDLDFYRINDDVADLAVGAVETADHSALTGHGHPEPIDRSRPYGRRGGLRPPLALHQTDLERQMPRNPDGGVTRTADPRRGGWFRLANDGGPAADATRGINCLDCTLSLFETWVHGRPRVAAPRTFDGYLNGDVNRPVGGEADGPLRVEQTTGGRFQDLCPPDRPGVTPRDRQRLVDGGYRDLYAQLASGGHGSYAFLITSFEGGGSHAWVALNQNGTILFLDPQTGLVADRPLYHHSGRPAASNVVGVDALVLGPDGRPMPLTGRPPGTYNVLPEPLPRPAPPRPPAPPPIADGHVPDFNHVHLLGESTTIHRRTDGPMPGSAPSVEPDPDRVREDHRQAHADRIAAGLYVRDALAQSGNLDAAFTAGVTPVELAQHADVPTLRRLVPGLDESAAADLTRLFADPRVQRMLDQSWEAPPRREELLAETLVRQLAERPDLVRMILATPELANSLTARPLTLHHLASHQQAIDVLGEVMNDIAIRGAEAVIAPKPLKPHPTPISEEQRELGERVARRGQRRLQLGFDRARRDDEVYRLACIDRLYADAAAAQPELNTLAVALAGDQGSPDWRKEPKNRDRVLDKLIEYENDASKLKDLAGARVQFDTLDAVYQALGRLAADPDVVILHLKERFLDPQDSGYRDLLLNLRMSNGHMAELRLQLAAVEEVAEWEHALYEIRRDLEALSESEGRPLTQTERAIRDGLLRRAQSAYWSRAQESIGEVPPQ